VSTGGTRLNACFDGFAKNGFRREIIDRPKKGFPVPVCQWLQDDGFSGWVVEHLLGKQARLKYCFQPEAMQGQLRRAATGDLEAATKSWLLIVLETWLRGLMWKWRQTYYHHRMLLKVFQRCLIS